MALLVDHQTFLSALIDIYETPGSEDRRVLSSVEDAAKVAGALLLPESAGAGFGSDHCGILGVRLLI